MLSLDKRIQAKNDGGISLRDQQEVFQEGGMTPRDVNRMKEDRGRRQGKH